MAKLYKCNKSASIKRLRKDLWASFSDFGWIWPSLLQDQGPSMWWEPLWPGPSQRVEGADLAVLIQPLPVHSCCTSRSLVENGWGHKRVLGVYSEPPDQWVCGCRAFLSDTLIISLGGKLIVFNLWCSVLVISLFTCLVREVVHSHHCDPSHPNWSLNYLLSASFSSALHLMSVNCSKATIRNQDV